MYQPQLLPTPEPLPKSLDAARVARAGELAGRYPRPRQREFAVLMCERHPYAIDYLEQAPVLLLAVASKGSGRPLERPFTPPLNGRRYEQVLAEWGQLCGMGWRLPKLLAHYKIAPAFRAVLPGSCQAIALWPIRVMSRQLTGAQIAGAMPENKTRQDVWFRSLVNWYGQHQRRNTTIAAQGLDHPLAYTRWAAAAFGRSLFHTKNLQYAAGDLADFAIARGPAFNERWNALQAFDACGLWHQELAAKREAAEFDNDPPASYGDWPDVFRSSTGHQLVALRTRRQLYDEGRAMLHCVGNADYAEDVAFGYSRIYSVRRPSGEPICTIEFSCKRDTMERLADEEIARALSPDGRLLMAMPSRRPWRLVQTQGGRSHWSQERPLMPTEAGLPVQEFMLAYCPGQLR